MSGLLLLLSALAAGSRCAPLPEEAIAALRSGSVHLEAFVQDEKGRPVENAVVFVNERLEGRFPPPQEPYVLDQIDRQFQPRVLPIIVGGTVRFPNKDNIYHHIYSFSEIKTFEIPLYIGEKVEPIRFDKPGVAHLGCNIHDWMSGVVLVLPNPYFKKTDAGGGAVLELPRRPAYRLAVFHERLAGSVDATARSVALPEDGPARAEWTLTLRPQRRLRRHLGY